MSDVSSSIHREDQALVREVLDGGAGAYDRLLARIEPNLKGFLRGQVANRPDLSVDEILQDVRIYLFQRLDRYNPEYPLAVFARGLAKNVAKRHIYRKPDILSGPSGDDEDDWSMDLSPVEMKDLPGNLQDVMGVGRFKDPGAPPPSRKFLEVLEVFFQHGGYPHQQVCFGFSILVWGKAKKLESAVGLRTEKVPVVGEPDRVVAEVGPEQLENASRDMVSDLEEKLNLDADYARRARRPLDVRLGLRCDELFSKDKASRNNFDKLLECLVGDTMLREYFGKDPRKSVADWTYSVKERVRKAFLDPDFKNPFLPPVPPENSASGGVDT